MIAMQTHLAEMKMTVSSSNDCIFVFIERNSEQLEAILSVFSSQMQTSPINIDDSIPLETRLLLPYLIKSSN